MEQSTILLKKTQTELQTMLPVLPSKTINYQNVTGRSRARSFLMNFRTPMNTDSESDYSDMSIASSDDGDGDDMSLHDPMDLSSDDDDDDMMSTQEPMSVASSDDGDGDDMSLHDPMDLSSDDDDMMSTQEPMSVASSDDGDGDDMSLHDPMDLSSDDDDDDAMSLHDPMDWTSNGDDEMDWEATRFDAVGEVTFYMSHLSVSNFSSASGGGSTFVRRSCRLAANNKATLGSFLLPSGDGRYLRRSARLRRAT
jgi:hypothetical protein